MTLLLLPLGQVTSNWTFGWRIVRILTAGSWYVVLISTKYLATLFIYVVSAFGKPYYRVFFNMIPFIISITSDLKELEQPNLACCYRKHIFCPMVLPWFQFPARMKYGHFVHMRHVFTIRDHIYCIARHNGSILWNSVATQLIFCREVSTAELLRLRVRLIMWWILRIQGSRGTA